MTLSSWESYPACAPWWSISSALAMMARSAWLSYSVQLVLVDILEAQAEVVAMVLEFS